MGSGKMTEAVRNILGEEETSAVKPPPEYFTLRREIQQQRNKVRDLRKGWWSDHQNFQNVVDRVHLEMRRHAESSPEEQLAHLEHKEKDHGRKTVRWNHYTPNWVSNLAAADTETRIAWLKVQEDTEHNSKDEDTEERKPSHESNASSFRSLKKGASSHHIDTLGSVMSRNPGIRTSRSKSLALKARFLRSATQPSSAMAPLAADIPGFTARGSVHASVLGSKIGAHRSMTKDLEHIAAEPPQDNVRVSSLAQFIKQMDSPPVSRPTSAGLSQRGSQRGRVSKESSGILNDALGIGKVPVKERPSRWSTRSSTHGSFHTIYG